MMSRSRSQGTEVTIVTGAFLAKLMREELYKYIEMGFGTYTANIYILKDITT